mmetsp:Transcript_67949/g.180835  ORF Transcript_67949/g.180835 Transcript_67949/m.180835 type:complete len:358 (-) Transcript_67949:51-1124(-)
MEFQPLNPLDEHFDSEERAAPAVPAARPVAWRLAVVTAAAVLATVVFAVGGGSVPSPLLRSAARPALVGLSELEDDPCDAMPFLRVMGIKSNNLGGKGPDTGVPEGIFYEAKAFHSGLNNSNDLQIRMNVVSENYFSHAAESEGANLTAPTFHPEWPKVNGVTGHFATINVHPGTNVTVRIHAYDATEKKNISLPNFAVTFFDLDTGENGTNSVEFLKINNFKACFTTNTTELEVRKEEDGVTEFTATVEGTGDDNPENPLQLTELQKNRAVTCDFHDQTEAIFQIGASDGDAARVFQFVMRPIMHCAYTKLADGTLLAADDPMSPFSLVQHAGGEHARGSLALVLGLALVSMQRWL